MRPHRAWSRSRAWAGRTWRSLATALPPPTRHRAVRFSIPALTARCRRARLGVASLQRTSVVLPATQRAISRRAFLASALVGAHRTAAVRRPELTARDAPAPGAVITIWSPLGDAH